MDSHELGYWSTAAQIAAVFALTFVIELRALRTAANPLDSPSWLRWVIVIFWGLSGALVATAFYIAINVLRSGESSEDLMDMQNILLASGFSTVVLGPIIMLLVQWAPFGEKPRTPRRRGALSRKPAEEPAADGA